MKKESSPVFAGITFIPKNNDTLIARIASSNYSFISATEQNQLTTFITTVCDRITREPYTVRQHLNGITISESDTPMLLLTTNLTHVVTKTSYAWSHLLEGFNKPLAHLQVATFTGYRFYFKCDGLVYAVTIGDCPDKCPIDDSKLHNHYPDVLDRLTFILRDAAKHYDEKRDKFYQLPFTNVKIEIV